MVGCTLSKEDTVTNFPFYKITDMKKIVLAVAATAALLTACTKQPEPQKHLFLAIGQSNMVGKGEVSAEDSIVSPRFLNLSSTKTDDREIGEWRVARPGNCRPGYEYPNYVSLTDHFGKTLLEYLPEIDSIGVLQVGVDGCPMRLFDPDQYKGFVDSCQMDWMNGQLDAYDRQPYERLITLAKQAQSQGWVIRGILVHQGETDAYSDYWPKETDKVYRNLLNVLGLTAENVPLIAGEAIGIDQNGVCAHCNPTIDRLHDFVPTGWTISAYGCEKGPDNLHFSAAGYHRLGRRYAIKWLQLNGYQVEDDTDCKLQCELGDPSDAFSVTAMIRPKSQWSNETLVLASAVALHSVDIVSYSGATLATLELGDVQTAEFDISAYSGEDRLVLNIHSATGETVNKQVNR